MESSRVSEEWGLRSGEVISISIWVSKLLKIEF
jgi:hypothetical protein